MEAGGRQEGLDLKVRRSFGTLVDPMPSTASVESRRGWGWLLAFSIIGCKVRMPVSTSSSCWSCVVNVLKVMEDRGYTKRGMTAHTGSPPCGP